MFRIKICGITTPADARLAAQAGADAIGINFYAGSPRFVEAKVAEEIAAAVPATVAKVGVFVNQTVERIEALISQVPLDFVQLHGDEPPEMFAELGPARIIKAFRSQDSGLTPVADFLAACGLAHAPAAVLIDAHAPGQFGGTGVSLDWTTVGNDTSLPPDVPLLLAGGLNADNVAEAIRLARPFGVDVASGVELSPGVKDADSVRAFVENAARAFGS